eukprot:CCRYP_005378-RA/>CCRYP_005378-RA protein AED:0.38 eAED:1.00 QI:0/-1/0/1/-1/0/1/0/32
MSPSAKIMPERECWRRLCHFSLHLGASTMPSR